jgi:transcriptional regulator with XRE-family HTH domain
MSAQVRPGRMLGSKLRALRKRNGLTLDELSQRCAQRSPRHAPSVSYLSMLETGKRVPSPEVLDIIAAEFGKPAAWFLDGALGAGTETVADPSPTADDVSIHGTPFEPAFLFSPAMLRTALPELLLQTGMSGRAFAQLLLRVWQETQHNEFPDIERAAEAAGQREMPLGVDRLLEICARHGLEVRWLDDDRRRLNRGLSRARFEAPGTILVSRRLTGRESRLKYELAYFLGHRLLHGGDGAIAPIHGDRVGDDAAAGAGPGLGPRDALYAWRDFECRFFAGALLCPRTPFRQLLVREQHRLAIHRKLGVGPAVVMRRMTGVSPYRHWHFFDAYPPGLLRTVYRGNGIPLPWGNLSLVPDPCPHWAVFRMLHEYSDGAPLPARPTSQISVMQDGGRTRLYCCHSLVTRDAADAVRVLSVGIDLVPALEAQGIPGDAIVAAVWQACRANGGSATLPGTTADALRTVAQVVRIGWIADAVDTPARIICSRSQGCPRERPCRHDRG